MFDGEVELDESYFGGIRKGKRGRAAGKTAVFGLSKCNGKVFVIVVKDTKTDTIIPIITSKIKPDSIVYTDSHRSYNSLDVRDFKHFRINHSKEFAQDYNHISGINKKQLHLFIKECEFCFNYGTPSNQLKVLRKWCEI